MNHGKSGWLGTSRRLWHGSRKLRFLIVGGWNTVFGYLCFTGLYLLAGDYVHYLIITTVAHAINIAQAYVMHRHLVFRSEARVAGEFLRFNASHIGTFLLGLLAMYILVEAGGLSPLVAQALVILMNLVLSYVLHSRVTFAGAPDRQGPRS
jgi:putative flippase GtrA